MKIRVDINPEKNSCDVPTLMVTMSSTHVSTAGSKKSAFWYQYRLLKMEKSVFMCLDMVSRSTFFTLSLASPNAMPEADGIYLRRCTQ